MTDTGRTPFPSLGDGPPTPAQVEGYRQHLRGNWDTERTGLPEMALAGATPWTLVVTFADAEEYQEAERLTAELLLSPDDWKLHPVVRYESDYQRIRLGGQRRVLAGPLGFYLGGWESAQLELRPTTGED